MGKERLTFDNLRHISNTCTYWITCLSVEDTHLNKCMVSILANLVQRINVKMIGFVNPKGFVFKLKPYEREAIYYMRNEQCAPVKDDNSFVRLLKQNN